MNGLSYAELRGAVASIAVRIRLSIWSRQGTAIWQLASRRHGSWRSLVNVRKYQKKRKEG